MKKIKKVVAIVIIVLVSVASIGVVTVYSVWHNEISTAFSFKKLRNRDDSHNDGSLYEMTVSGDYYFDEFLKTGASNDKELISFITSKIIKGLIPMKISESDIACSAFTAVLDNGDRVFGKKI